MRERGRGRGTDVIWNAPFRDVALFDMRLRERIFILTVAWPGRVEVREAYKEVTCQSMLDRPTASVTVKPPEPAG